MGIDSDCISLRNNTTAFFTNNCYTSILKIFNLFNGKLDLSFSFVGNNLINSQKTLLITKLETKKKSVERIINLLKLLLNRVIVVLKLPGAKVVETLKLE